MKKSFLIGIVAAISLSSCYKEEVKPAQSIIYNDDFTEDTDLSWTYSKKDTITSKISDGRLSITNGKTYDAIMVTNTINIDESKDFSIISPITKTTTSNSNGFGIVWGRKTSEDSYYYFAISQNGAYQIVKVENNELTYLKETTAYSNINTGANTLKITKSGNMLIFRINDEKVFSTPFQPFFGNDVGYIVGSKNEGISADFLAVYQ